MRVNMIELRFTGGGPMDGHTLAAEAPAGEWFEVEGGCYQLWDHAPAVDAVTDPPIATYEWIPHGEV
jgi:hypothetical protein